MQTAIREYDTKLDAKRRITLRNVSYEYYHVSELSDGRILLEPRELVVPFALSANTLQMMDNAMENFRVGKISDAVDLTEFEG